MPIFDCLRINSFSISRSCDGIMQEGSILTHLCSDNVSLGSDYQTFAEKSYIHILGNTSFEPEDGGSKIFRHLDSHIPNYTSPATHRLQNLDSDTR